MPIYEFYCPKNNTVYSFLSQRSISGEEIPRCPADSRFKMERLVSGFSVTGRHAEKEAGDGLGDMDDSRMEAAMAELESEMSGMDEENPDPRQMGRLMRRMSELTGESLDGQMEEMVRKMEEGQDMEALEEEFGDAMDDEEVGAEEGGDEPSGNDALRKLMRNYRDRGPRKDPVLYDWRDYT